ncbi:Lrp/AsnC family transcriptional regulator [Nocardia asteroides]|uniref:Lrp/AsnC family transcriptional regulator n=1 Tax=Nocardia asteroides TaxID=1824 RepID=UPI001E2F32F9|nr:Lrp/AsnC family transcriptional regulator [Nocardia asteroides]UGT55096.1 Lrp/AsnC family transcriptional regulator [Nocardia asteroides]
MRTVRSSQGSSIDARSGRSSILDDLDRALVRRLRVDGRESNRSLATALEIGEVNVAGRLRRMAEANIMRIVAVADIQLFGHREFAFALISVSGRPAFDVAEDVARIPEVQSATVCTGQCDIIATVLGRDLRHVGSLFDHALRRVEGVAAVQGSITLDVVKFDSTWAMLSASGGPAPEAGRTQRADATDLAIIGLLQLDARRSNRGIATELNISEGTVRRRIKQMQADRIFRIQAVSDAGSFGIAAYAFVGISTIAGAVTPVSRALMHRADVAQVFHVLGDFDIMALITGTERESLMTAILDEIATLHGVRRIAIFDAHSSPKHNYAWAWLV